MPAGSGRSTSRIPLRRRPISRRRPPRSRLTSTEPDSSGPARGGVVVMAIDQQELQSTPDLKLDELDRDGAIREAVEQVSGETRAAFLGKATVGGAALLGALAAPPIGQASAASDVAILNYALTLEYLKAAFSTETERLDAVGGELKRVPRQLGAVERAHVAAIKKALGRAAVKRPAFNFRGVTEDSLKFLKTALAFEDLAVAAYKAQAARIQSPALLAAAISIHSVEARHAARREPGRSRSTGGEGEWRTTAENARSSCWSRFGGDRSRRSRSPHLVAFDIVLARNPAGAGSPRLSGTRVESAVSRSPARVCRGRPVGLRALRGLGPGVGEF